MTEAVRTPEERFEALPGFDFESRYAEVGALRLAYVDEGEGQPVVFFHGEPTWSYLWRKVIPPVRDAGHRCIAPDLPGFGRSDKPTDIDWYSYDRHVELTSELLAGLGLRDATAVVHDWGGAIGLRIAVSEPEWFSRLVIMEPALFTGRQKMTDAWTAFRDFVQRTEDLPVGMLVRRACLNDPGDQVAAAYEAPYPDPASKAGARAFPLILPTEPDAPGAAAGRRLLESLREDDRPIFSLWADSDPIMPPEVGERVCEAIGAPPPRLIEGASHFLQEDAGERIGALIAEWLDSEFAG
jgi:haloalkane dehalogenase